MKEQKDWRLSVYAAVVAATATADLNLRHFADGHLQNSVEIILSPEKLFLFNLIFITF